MLGKKCSSIIHGDTPFGFSLCLTIGLDVTALLVLVASKLTLGGGHLSCLFAILFLEMRFVFLMIRSFAESAIEATLPKPHLRENSFGLIHVSFISPCSFGYGHLVQ